jgi:hypothetical protein
MNVVPTYVSHIYGRTMKNAHQGMKNFYRYSYRKNMLKEESTYYGRDDIH